MRHFGIRRLEDEHAARPELPVAEVDELDDPKGVEVLDDLRGEDAAERIIGKRAEVGKGVVRADVQSLFPAQKDHVEVEIHAAGPDATLSHQLEELSSAAPDVDDIVPPFEVRDVDPLTLLDFLLGPAEPLFKARIVELGPVCGYRRRHACSLARRWLRSVLLGLKGLGSVECPPQHPFCPGDPFSVRHAGLPQSLKRPGLRTGLFLTDGRLARERLTEA